MKHVFCVLFCIAIVCSYASAEKWISHGPYGGYFQSFEFHPEKSNIIFASSFDGLFRSIDSGLTWQRVQLPGGEFTVRIHRKSPAILAANYSKGVFQSTDLGITWEQ